MQETKQKFYELADVLLRESGLLANRPTWIKLRQLVHDAPPDFLESDCRSRTFSILLILLRTYEKSAERTKKLAVIIESACKTAPDEAFINILTHLSPDDLTITLLPQIYCSDSRGSIAIWPFVQFARPGDAEAEAVRTARLQGFAPGRWDGDAAGEG